MAMDQPLASPGRPLPRPDLAVDRPLEHEGIVFRRPRTERGEHHHFVTLQGDVWHPEVATPAHQLIAAEKCGGIILGAFRDGEAVGFSYAFPGHRLGDVWLHSHQTGVQAGRRNHGVGATLKWLQRWLAREEGYAAISWTFDPLQSRNAFFNFAKLGVVAQTYKIDCYGRFPGQPSTDPTDRLWVEWHLDSPRVAERFLSYLAASTVDWSGLASSHSGTGAGSRVPSGKGRPHEPAGTPLIATRAGGPGIRMPVEVLPLDGAAALHLEVPTDLDLVETHHGTEGTAAWRLAVRRAFLSAFEQGYTATGFLTRPGPEGRRSWYELTRS